MGPLQSGADLGPRQPSRAVGFGCLGQQLQDLGGIEVLALLTTAPEPNSGARSPPAQISAALKRAHRRDREAKTTAIMAALRTEHLTQPPVIAAAYGATVRALAALIATSNEQITALEG